MDGRTEIRFRVIGDPKPAGSKRAFQHPHTKRIIVTDDSGKAGKSWRREIQDAAAEAMAGAPPLTGPLHVAMTFRVRRPKSHSGSGRNSDTLKPSAPRFPTTRPDVLKLARACEDAMSSIVYGDDAQIVVEPLCKLYDDDGPVGVDVVVSEIRPGDQLELRGTA